MPPHAPQTATPPAQPSPDINTCQSHEVMRASYTPIPNVVFDHIMPTLSGSEWQLLCVIIRQTQGWHDPSTGGRKTNDWLSHQQLKARTGRGSDAICHAIESLVRKGHIEVKDDKGNPLSTAHERRRNGSRLFYGLSFALHSHFQPSDSVSSTPVRETRIGKAETTKETPTKLYGQPFGKSQTTTFPATAPRSKATSSSEGCGCLFRPQNKPPIAASPTHNSVLPSTYSKEVSHLVEAYEDLMQKHESSNANSSASPLLSQDSVDRLEKALSRYGEEQLLAFLEAFFESDFSVMKRNSSLTSFIDSVHILAARRPKIA